MNKLTQSPARERIVSPGAYIPLRGSPWPPSGLSWAASLLLSLGALFAQPAFAGCVNAIDGYVQHKIAWTKLAKCGFTEYTNLDLPRVHIYHKQVTHEVYAEYSYSSSTNSTNFTVTTSCGGGGWSTVTYSPGYTYSSSSEGMDVTNTELNLGMFCDYTNICGGTWGLSSESQDTRHHDGIGCDSGTICKTYSYGFEDRSLGAQLVPYNGYPTWCWVGWDHNIGQSSGCHTWDNVTNDTIVDWVSPIGVPTPGLYFWELTNLAPTHLDYILPPEIYEPAGISGTCSFDLSQEYTDGELRSNILGSMPQYPADWYTPSGNWYDVFATIAYSVIDGDHINAGYWWSPYQRNCNK